MRGEFQCCWQARCSNKILMNVYVPPKLRGLSPSPNTNFPLHSTVTMIVEIKFCQRNHITSKNNFHCHWVKDEILVSGGTCNNEVNTTKPTQNITLTKPLVESNDTGCYQLLFSNAYGHWLSNRLCVNVTGPLPRVPYSVTAQAVRLTSGDSGINVSWTDSVSTLSSNHFNTGKIRHLVVQYRTTGARVWKEDIIKTVNNHTHIIRHLLPCEPYEVTVTAVNQFGSSKPTPITEVTTTPNSTSPQFIIGKDLQKLLLKKYNSDPLMACIRTNISNDVIHSLCNLPATDSGNVPHSALHHDRVYVTNWNCSSSLSANNCYWTCPLLIATCPSGYNKFSIKRQCQHENPKHEKESQNITIAVVVSTVLGFILICCLVACVIWCKRSALATVSWKTRHHQTNVCPLFCCC
ncbi:uncharacterized protein LOC134177114 [Corticium candelabrum]|uniref:uncharacterized protein LOC134177114 n=1 Tax=Corticium candelabrum TaxID=121492 RepID=UPI002E25464F|nr:uncharacterized protein LOC134177114 [Corticium candelabrum]